TGTGVPAGTAKSPRRSAPSGSEGCQSYQQAARGFAPTNRIAGTPAEPLRERLRPASTVARPVTLSPSALRIGPVSSQAVNIAPTPAAAHRPQDPLHGGSLAI